MIMFAQNCFYTGRQASRQAGGCERRKIIEILQMGRKKENNDK
jgi:hypothetical protein